MVKSTNKRSVESISQVVSLSTKWKLLISSFVVFHLLAVIAEPFSFFTRGATEASPAARPLRQFMSPYIEFGYLNHGYFFFAPNPGPSHLLECHLKSGQEDHGRLRLPDRRAQWPRLLYHRHFMLAEFLHQLHVPPVTAEVEAANPDKNLVGAWRSERARFELVRNSMIKHLRNRYHVDSAEIYRLEHRLPSDIEVFQEKIPLNDERLYAVLPDVPIDSLPAAPTPAKPTTGFPIAPETIPSSFKDGLNVIGDESKRKGAP